MTTSISALRLGQGVDGGDDLRRQRREQRVEVVDRFAAAVRGSTRSPPGQRTPAGTRAGSATRTRVSFISSVTVAIVVEARLLESAVDRRFVGSHGREDPVVVAMIAASSVRAGDDSRAPKSTSGAGRPPAGRGPSGSAAGPPWRRRSGRSRRARCRPCRRPATPGRRPRRRRSAGSGRGSSAGTRQCVPWRSQSGSRSASSRWTGCGRRRRVQPRQRQGVERRGRADPAAGGPLVGPRLRAAAGSAGRNRIELLAVAHEAGLHEQLDVAVGVGAGDVEPRGAALRALAQELLDEPVADVAGVGHARSRRARRSSTRRGPSRARRGPARRGGPRSS